MTIRSKTMRALLLATTLAAGAGGVAWAQQATATYDPAQLPATHGTVGQYSLTPRGDVDGLILKDGTEIHLPPHLGAQLVFVAKPGDEVTIHGLKARDLALVQALQVTNDASNQSVNDMGPAGTGPASDEGRKEGPGKPHGHEHADKHGPEHGPGHGTPIEARGTVKQALHGPRGEVNGVLLSDGTIVRMPPPEATRLATQLAVGQSLFVRGEGSASPLGRVVAAREIGADAEHLTALQAPPRPPHAAPAPAQGYRPSPPLPPQGGPAGAPGDAPTKPAG